MVNADIGDAVVDGIILRMARSGAVRPDDLDRLIEYIKSLRNSRPRLPK